MTSWARSHLLQLDLLCFKFDTAHVLLYLDIMDSTSVDLPSPVNEEFMDAGECSDTDQHDVSLHDSIFVPTPDRHLKIKLNRVESHKVAFMDTAELDKFVSVINEIRGCKTPNCKGKLIPVEFEVKSTGLGGALNITYVCDGCQLRGANFTTCALSKLINHSEISLCIQVAFIIAGCTHATYYKTLQHSLGIAAVGMHVFLRTIELMFPIVKKMLDELCETAKQEMRDMGAEQLGSWARAVTAADGVWHTRGWHSKNATFSIRNYLNGALLYYMHVCQKGGDRIIEDELYQGTSKSAEGYAASVTFEKAKEEGMQVAIHWQDADSSSANAVREAFPDAEIMLCSGHAGRAHRKILEARAKQKVFSEALISKYKGTFPDVSSVTCKCPRNHKSGCGCLSAEFIGKAHTNFTSLLMTCELSEEFVRRLEALTHHVQDEHEWEEGRCEFHPLRVCTCGECEGEPIKCEGKPYHTRIPLSCPFHILAYKIDCHYRASQAKQLVHPILKRGHSNSLEASHNVLLRFRSKDVPLERLHYQLSTNLGLLQANLTYMYEKVGTHYHWIPELYRRMKLPVFDGVHEALQRYNVQRKKHLAEAKTDERKKRRVQLKKERIQKGKLRSMWSLKHGRHTYGHDEDHLECGVDVVAKGSKRESKRACQACGSSTHQRSNHKNCPSNKGRGATTSSRREDTPTNDISVYTDLEHESAYDNSVLSDVSDMSCLEEDIIDIVSGVQCTCGAEGRAHKKGCPMNSRNRYPGRALFPTMPDGSLEPPADKCIPRESCKAPPAKKRKVNMKVGDYVSIAPWVNATFLVALWGVLVILFNCIVPKAF